MKKECIIFLFLVITMLSFLNAVEVTGNTITGKVSNQKTNVSIFVLPAVPLIRIDTPTENATYDLGEQILLSYTAILIDTIWYNLDNTENITINTSTYFNASAGTHIIYLYGNESNGTILSDSVSFSVSAAPLPPTPPTGGRGGGVSVKKDFSVDKEIISVTLKQGETKEELFTVKNTGNKAMKFIIQNPKLREIIKISETEFTLNAEESKIIILDFLAKEASIPNLYLGKLIIQANGIEKEILISIEIESKKPLFDIKIEIPRGFMHVMPGGELISNIKIFNVERKRSADVLVEYIIKDEKGNEILSESEMIFVETQTTFTKSFEIPMNTKCGKYILYIKATYKEQTGSASAWFNVCKEPVFTLKSILIIGMIIGIIIGLIILIILFKKRKKKYKKRKKK
jgi:hypothetical protein